MAGDAPIEHTRWPVVSLAEIASKIGSGATPKGGADTYLPTRLRYALVRSQNVFDRRFDYAGLAFITDEQADALRGALLQPNDILLNITGDGVTFGRACTIPNAVLPACVNQHVSIIRINSQRADAGYVLAFLTHPNVKSYIESFNAGGSRRAITKGHIESFRLPLPPLHEQRAIAHILGTLDDKIELNRRRNATLEAMARALFKAWFVDFEPVRAKLDGRWQRGQSLPGLPAHLYELFPDRLVDSDLGEIPAGWEIKSLDQMARFLNGLALQKYPPDGDDSLPVIKIAQLRAGTTTGADRASANLNPDYIVADGDILFSWSGSLECVLWAGGPGALNQHLFKVTSAEYPRWLCYFAIRHHLPDFRGIAAGKATTMGHIQRHHLSDAKIAMPPAATLSAMDRLVTPIFEGLWKRAVESRTLATLRDALLPKLISGELLVKDAERILQAAG
jgi:type I restriction enzyme S subunit